MVQSKPVALPDVWRTCNKIRAAIFRSGLDLWDHFKPFDPNNNGLISESQFIATLSGPLRNPIGLTSQEIGELADYFRVQDGRIFYSQLCEVIHKSVPDLSKNEDFVSGLELEDPLHSNALGQTEERRLKVLLTKIAAVVNLRQLVLRPFFQDYELISKNCGTVTFAHFARILTYLGVHVSDDDFNLLIKKYVKDSYTISYNAFLAHVDEIHRYWEKYGITDLGGDVLNQFPGRIINAELPKLPRPEIGKIPASEIFGKQSIFHPVLSLPPPPEGLIRVIKRIQRYVFTNRIRTVEFFKDFDRFTTGRVTLAQFRRGLDALGIEAYHRLYLSELELWQIIQFYRDPNDQHRVCWKTFCDDIDQVFTTKGLEKWPEHRVDAPGREIEELPRKGQSDWLDVSNDVRDLAEDALDKVKKRTAKRRINLKPVFKDYDITNNGHVTRAQYRQCLLANGILISDEELYALEQRFNDDLGFNYLWFLTEVEPQKIQEPLYNEYVKLRKRINAEKPEPQVTLCERDIVMIMAKIKAKTVRERIRILDFLQVYDPNRERCIPRCNFVRAMDQGRYDLTKTELETLMDVFSSPGRKEFVDYFRMVEAIEECFTQGSLERAPMIVPLQHLPSESNPRNFLNFEERHLVSMALDKLAAHPNMDLDSLFQDYDKTNCGTVSKQQFTKALAVRGLSHVISSHELDVVVKAFGFLKGLREEVDYRAFSKALEILYVNSKKKPV